MIAVLVLTALTFIGTAGVMGYLSVSAPMSTRHN